MLSIIKREIYKLRLGLRGIQFKDGLRLEGFPKLIKSKNSHIIMGNKVVIRNNVEIRATEGSTLVLGDNVKVDNGVRIIATNGENVTIGDNVKLGYFSVLNGGGGIIIEENVSLYGFVYIQTSTHHDRGYLSQQNPDIKFSHESIKICNDTILGPHSTIMPGVTIGSHTTISANSVINKNVPSGTLYK